MSLIHQTDPVSDFIEQGRKFIDAPGAVSGMAFDDAVVKMKRHALSQLKDEELAMALGRLARLIRDQEMDALRDAFSDLAVQLGRNV